VPDRLDWEEARRREIVTKHGGVPSWSDMAGDTSTEPISRKGREALLRAASEEGRKVIKRYKALAPRERRERYAVASAELDAVYGRARQRIGSLPSAQRVPAKGQLATEEFQWRGELRRLSALRPDEARARMRAHNLKSSSN
jgi:hypothetical protein